MTTAQLLAEMLKRAKGRTEHLLGEFSEEEMLVRPVPGANHAMWQVGHVTQSTWRMISACDAAIKRPAFDSRFTKETASSDDPATFPSKGEVLARFGEAMDAAVAWMNGLSAADLDRPTPEGMRGFAPTVGHVAGLLSSHVTSHAGQYSVIRRKLGKAVLF